MTTQTVQLSEHTRRLDIEARWETVAVDYDDACALFRDAPVPGFRTGRAPASVVASYHGPRIRAAASQASAQRLVREAIREHKLRTFGPIVITHDGFSPGYPFKCSAELTLRPEFQLPDYVNNAPITTTTDEIAEWLLSNTTFDPPPHLVRAQLGTTTNDSVITDTTAWEEAAETVRLLIITHEIAGRDGIAITERQLSDALTRIAAESGITSETLLTRLTATGHLDNLRNHLLAETVLAYLSKPKPPHSTTVENPAPPK